MAAAEGPDAGASGAAETAAPAASEPAQLPDSQKEFEDFADVAKPVQRQCTDICCLLIFTCFMVGFTILNCYAYVDGQPRKFAYAWDHTGNVCGLDDFKDFPYVYYPSKSILGDSVGDIEKLGYYSNPKNLWGVCTRECPSGATAPGETREGLCPSADAAHCTWYSKSRAELVLHRFCLHVMDGQTMDNTTGVSCRTAEAAVTEMQEASDSALVKVSDESEDKFDEVNDEVSDDTEKAAVAKAAADVYSIIRRERKEMEDFSNETRDRFTGSDCTDEASAHEPGKLAKFVSNVTASTDILCICAAICVATCLAYLVIVTLFARVVVWCLIVITVIGFSCFGYVFWFGALEVMETGLIPAGQEEMYLAVICWIMAAILFFIAVVFRKQINLAITIAMETSTFLLQNVLMVMLPVTIAAIEIAWIIFWIYGFLAILSLVEVRPANNVTEEWTRFKVSEDIKWALLYQVLMGLWVFFFLEGLATVSTAIIVREWYFERTTGQGVTGVLAWYMRVPSFLKGLALGLRYHSGSIAFGSCLLAITNVIRAVLLYIEKQVTAAGQDNCVLRCIFRFFHCIMWCADKLIKFVNFNAYLMVGVTGKTFCVSARGAYKVMAAHPARFAAFHGVMWTLNFSGRMCIVGVTALFGFFLLNKDISPHLSEEIQSPFPGLLCVLVLGYFISGIFCTVLSTSGSALFYCYICDEEAGGDGSKAPGGYKQMLDENEKLGTSEKIQKSPDK